MINKFTFPELLQWDALELLKCILLSSLSVSLWILTDWIMTMEKAFLGCLAAVTLSLMYTINITYACQELNEAVHLPPDARGQSVCVHDGAIV